VLRYGKWVFFTAKFQQVMKWMRNKCFPVTTFVHIKDFPVRIYRNLCLTPVFKVMVQSKAVDFLDVENKPLSQVVLYHGEVRSACLPAYHAWYVS